MWFSPEALLLKGNFFILIIHATDLIFCTTGLEIEKGRIITRIKKKKKKGPVKEVVKSEISHDTAVQDGLLMGLEK